MLSFLDDDSKKLERLYQRSIRPISSAHMARKQRRKGSGSGLGRSSDKSRNKINRLAPYEGCFYHLCNLFGFSHSGTNSSGELFFNGDDNWVSNIIISMSSDVKTGKEVGGDPFFLAADQSNEYGYQSEPGCKEDEELGYVEDGARYELDEGVDAFFHDMK